MVLEIFHFIRCYECSLHTFCIAGNSFVYTSICGSARDDSSKKKNNNKKLINREIKLQDFFPMEEIHSLNENG